jgi:peptidyl-prolyl cis-trans isomerase SurA
MPGPPSARFAGRLLASGFCALLASSGPCSPMAAEVIDRIAITVANQVITASQIDEEVRVTAFLNNEKLDLSPAEKKKAAVRLIDQALIKREMDLSRYPLPALTDADGTLKDLKTHYSNPAAFEQSLHDYGITETQLQQHLWLQLTVLRFVDYRFRPGIQVPDSDIEAYYQQQLRKWKEQDVQPIPSLSDERAQIEEILTQQQIDDSLDHWLSETRNQVPVRFLDEALK